MVQVPSDSCVMSLIEWVEFKMKAFQSKIISQFMLYLE